MENHFLLGVLFGIVFSANVYFSFDKENKNKILNRFTAIFMVFMVILKYTLL